MKWFKRKPKLDPVVEAMALFNHTYAIKLQQGEPQSLIEEASARAAIAYTSMYNELTKDKK